MALRDISELMRQQNIQLFDEHGDVWVVTANQINTSEQRRLNKKLGISKINYSPTAMKRR